MRRGASCSSDGRGLTVLKAEPLALKDKKQLVVMMMVGLMVSRASSGLIMVNCK